jgi:Zn-dependent protease
LSQSDPDGSTAPGCQPATFGVVLFDFTLNQLVLRLVALVFIAGVHGAAVAAAACTLGDQGPRYDGRLRLNPLVHLDLLGTLSGVLFSVGWAKPIAIDPAALRQGRIGLVLIVIGGATATLLSAFVLLLVRPMLMPLLADTASQTVFALIETIGQLSLWFVLVNLLPVPCLTGGHLLTALMPAWCDLLRRSQLYAAVLLTVLAGFGVVTGGLGSAYRVLAGAVMGE